MNKICKIARFNKYQIGLYYYPYPEIKSPKFKT